MLLECINTSVWNLFIIPEEDWSQSKSIEKYEVNKLKNEDGYSCFYAFVQKPPMHPLTDLLHSLPPLSTPLAHIRTPLLMYCLTIVAGPCLTACLPYKPPIRPLTDPATSSSFLCCPHIHPHPHPPPSLTRSLARPPTHLLTHSLIPQHIHALTCQIAVHVFSVGR